ncbi:hypothetical protein [Streptomyces sp. NPDC001404]|uniref:hypothetical protein n=1 Tax=Streptomyces sp. NPDC001404 TaxID=3364571 RepID=UPI0036C4FA86
MADVVVEPSGLAPFALVREVRRMVGPAVCAVEGHFGVPMPPVTVVVAARTGLATSSLLAAGWRRGSVKARVGYWRSSFVEAGVVQGITVVTRTDRVLVGLNWRALKRLSKDLLYSVLVHELTHAMQADRPGRREERRSLVDCELGLEKHPMGQVLALSAINALDEAEAYAVEHALCPGSDRIDEYEAGPFDVAAMAEQLDESVKAWTAAALSYQTA